MKTPDFDKRIDDLKRREENKISKTKDRMKNFWIKLIVSVILALASQFAHIFEAKAILETNTEADVVIGQLDSNSCTANQGDMFKGQNSPSSAVVADGKLIVADTSNSRVLIYNSVPASNNVLPDVILGPSNLCNTSANQGLTTATANSLSTPYGVYSDGTKLFIADSGNHRVLIFNSIPTQNGANADVVIGQQNFSDKTANPGGANENTLSSPRSIYSDGHKLFIADYSNNRILIFNSIPNSNNASADVVVGQADMTTVSSNTGGRNANRLSGPSGVFSDGTKLFISDSGNHRILIFNSIPVANGASANVVVGQSNMTNGGANQGGAVNGNTLNAPGTVYSSSSKLIISDTSNNRILVYDSIPSSDNASADVVVGQADMTHNSANQSSAVAANTANAPRSAFSNGAKLYVADTTNNRILVYNSIPSLNNASADIVLGQSDMAHNSANQPGTVKANTLYSTSYVFSAGGKLFVTDANNNRVLIFNSIPTSSNADADVVIGQPNMTSNLANQGGTPAANTLKNPYGVWSDGVKILIADYQNNRVLVYNQIPTQNNASADVVIGQADFTHGSANQGGAVGANTINGPIGVFFDGSKLFISEILNNRVLVYNQIPTQNNASADVVIGQADFTHGSANQGGAVGANTLKFPFHMFSNGQKLVLADAQNNRVLVYNQIPTQNNASADVVIGQADFTHGSANQGGAVGANTFNFVTGVYLDGEKLIIGDNINYRALVFNTIPEVNNASADVVLGQSDFTSNNGNQGSRPGANTIYGANNTCIAALSDGTKILFVSDFLNNRAVGYVVGPKNESMQMSSSATSSPSINLSLSASEAKDMMISENPNFTGSSWEPYTVSKSWTLSERDGTKIVYVKFRDYANFEGRTVSRQIMLDTTPPVISETSNLSGATLPPGTISRDLILTTSENSACRYSTSQNDSFSQMSVFSSTGGTNHSTILSNLQDGNAYAYFVKCQDSLLNSVDYQISFSLASPAYAPIIAIGQHKVYNLSPQETVALRVKNLFFKGKIESLRNGKVEIYENEKLKKTIQIKKNSRWRVKIRQKTPEQLHAYQFKYFNSRNEEVLASNVYNILIDRIKPKFINLPKKITKESGDTVYWQVSDNDQMKYYQYTFRGRKIKTNNPQFILPKGLPKGISRLIVRAYDRAENKSVRKVRVRIK